LDGFEGGIVNRKQGETPRRRESLISEAHAGEYRQRDCPCKIEIKMRNRREMITALIGISLCRILNGPQVIADRDNREQDGQKHDEGDDLQAPV